MPSPRRSLPRALASLLVLVSLGATAASAQPLSPYAAAATAPPNLVNNGRLVSNISGWSPHSQGTAAWVPTDATGDPRSGSMALVHTSPGPSGVGARQCRAVVPGTTYTAGAMTLVPTSAPVGGDAIVSLAFYSGSDCAGHLVSKGGVSSVRGRWAPATVTLTAFSNARSVGVSVVAYKSQEAAAPLIVYVDDVYLREGKCGTGPQSLCLNGERFSVVAKFRAAGAATAGTAGTAPFTADSGSFWFFDPSNLEVNVKILDACGLNGRFWVFAAGSTNVEVVLFVTDTVTGQTKTYVNPLGKLFATITDTGSFSCA